MKHLFLLFATILSCNCYAQEEVIFKTNKQFYLKGNSALNGNNIVSAYSKKSFNDGTKLNDLVKQRYVDIDNATFSSSLAILKIPENSKIKYAALYWSAIYTYNQVKTEIIKLKTKRKQITYVGDDTRDLSFNTILFIPPKSDYKPIKGHIIFNGSNSEKFEDTKPYDYYADVTSILQNTKTPNGNYTLANVKAAQGLVPGGCASGWLLYIIYENENQSAKYFTTYNGFLDVFKEPVNIHFKNFKSPEEGRVKTALLLGALEGDQKFKTNNCAILNPNNNEYVPLFNKVRPRNNFFNSTIFNDEAFFLDRVPTSRNTLGFDLLKMEIPNPNNTIIPYNSRDATAQFNSKADRFYLFFVAFETEISPIFLEGKENKESIFVLNKEDVLKQEEELEKIRNLVSISIPSIPQGYYLVTNVFSVEENATKWMSFLTEKGHNPKSYINPGNRWKYIYLNIDLDPYTCCAFKKKIVHLMKK